MAWHTCSLPRYGLEGRGPKGTPFHPPALQDGWKGETKAGGAVVNSGKWM